MNVHQCKICSLDARAQVEGWRVKGGLSYRQIQKRMADELGASVALGTIASHFKFVDAEVDEAVQQQVRTAAARDADAAMNVFPRNIEIADAVLGRIMPDDQIQRPQFVPYVATMLKERRESALASLRFTPADPESSIADSLADIALEVAGLRDKR